MANLRNNVTLSGGRELAELLTELPNRVKRKGLRAAVTAASAPVLRQARAKAPKGETGLLRKAMGRKVKTYKGTAAAIVGARKDISGSAAGVIRRAMAKGDTRKASLAAKRVPANYLHLVDGGTRPHAVGKRHHPGAKANPFLALAYHQTKSAAEGIAAAKLKEVVESEARKLGKL